MGLVSVRGRSGEHGGIGRATQLFIYISQQKLRTSNSFSIMLVVTLSMLVCLKLGLMRILKNRKCQLYSYCCRERASYRVAMVKVDSTFCRFKE